jgi:hypothetical protein
LAAEGEQSALEQLAAEGGDVALAGILELASLYADRSGRYIAALGGFVPPKCASGKRKRDKPITAANQARLMKRLQELAARVEEGDEAAAFAEALAESCHPELLKSAILLAKLPFSRPREILAGVFSQYGVKPEWPQVSGQVEFLLTLDGKPLANENVGWYMLRSCPEENCGGASSERKTDSSGRLAIQRDVLRPGGRLVFSAGTRKNRAIHRLFYQDVMLPERIPARIGVPVQTGSLRISFTGPLADIPATRKVYLHSRRLASGTERWVHFSLGQTLSGGLDFAKGSEAEFSALPPDHYRICASAPGWGYACLDTLEILPGQAATAEFRPERGADFTFRIVDAATGKDAFMSWEIVKQGGPFFPGGAPRQYSPPGMLGVPLGKYTLKLRGFPVVGNTGPAYLSREVPFAVDSAAPALIDLGTIRIEKAAP